MLTQTPPPRCSALCGLVEDRCDLGVKPMVRLYVLAR